MTLLLSVGCGPTAISDNFTDVSTGTVGEPDGTGSTGSTGAETSGTATSEGVTSAGTSSGETTGSPEPPAECDGSAAHTIFVNFDGPTLQSGCGHDPSMDCSALCTGEVPAYAGDDKDEIIEILQAHWAPFDACLTRVRPASDLYEMVVVTPLEAPTPTCAVGGTINLVAFIDCGGSTRTTNFVLPRPGWSANTIAVAISNVSGLALGLGFQEGHEGDIMRWEDVPVERYSVTEELAFVDECLEIRDGYNSCPLNHEPHCPAGEQNSYRELLATLGPAK